MIMHAPTLPPPSHLSPPVAVAPVRVIRLPNGRAVTLSAYVRAWRKLVTMECAGQSDAQINGWGHCPESARVILAAIRAGMDDRINRHDPAFGKGRKWDSTWQNWTANTARRVNTPRLRVYVTECPAEYRGRLAHRLASSLDD